MFYKYNQYKPKKKNVKNNEKTDILNAPKFKQVLFTNASKLRYDVTSCKHVKKTFLTFQTII